MATADNPSAIYYNPAGISQLDGLNARFGAYSIYMNPRYTPPGANQNTFEIENKLAAAPQVFVTYSPHELPLSFGLGAYAPFGAEVAWPQDTGFRTIATEARVTYLTLNPVLAVELAPGLSIGAGATINYGDITLEQGLLRTERPFDNQFKFSGDGWSVGSNLGLLWKIHEKVSVGGSLRTASRMTAEGQTDMEQQPIIQRTKIDAEAEFEFPLIAIAGISFRPTPAWNIEFNADYTDWSCFDEVLITQRTQPPFPVARDIPVTLQWQASWMYKAGVTRYFQSGWHLSAGYAFNENSVPDDYYTPLAADMDRHFFSAGAGYKGKNVAFDIAYQFGYGPDRVVTGSRPSSTPGRFSGQSADGTYEFTSHAVMVTFGLSF